METLIIATRSSDLALWQANYIKSKIESHYPNIEVKLNKITSNGDKILDKPLALIGGKGHFTKELEDEMLLGNAHLAVHSLKDVPTFIPEGLELSAITQRQDQSDVFLSHKYSSLEELPIGAVVGTTSLRRRMQLLNIRPDLIVKDLRGNVNTRLRKLKEGQYDAIILAFIGLYRLDLLKDIPYTKKFPLGIMIPPMGQAALGIEIIKENKFLKEISSILNHDDTSKCTVAERDFIAAIGAGCSAPVACNAKINDRTITLTTMIGYPDGTKIIKETLSYPVENYKILGKEMAKIMLAHGVEDILKDAEKMAFKNQRPDRI